MAVKVLIERWVKAGYENAVWEKLRDLRSEAVRQRGYLYGETWRSVDNPRVFMVLSVWGTREHWENWSKDEFRRKMDDTINVMLRKPYTIRVFEEVSTIPAADDTRRRRARRPSPNRRLETPLRQAPRQ